MASAMGERSAFCVQQKRTLPGSSPTTLSPDVQDADQGEETTRGGAVELDLACEPLTQEVGALVVQPAPAHVDGLDLRGRGGADGLVVAFADREVVLDDPPEGREREDHLGDLIALLRLHIE